MSILRQEKRILSDVADNSNKYWSGTLTDSFEVVLEWGRVGNTLQSKTKAFDSQYAAQKFLDSKLYEKERKGYSKLNITGPTGTIIVEHDKSSLSSIAKSQIVSDDETKKLIDKLSHANVHNILTSTTLTFQHDTGLFATPLGIVTSDSIKDARLVLNDISIYVERSDFKNTNYFNLLNRYLRLIPQKVGSRINPETIYSNLEAIKKQNDILDSLEVSYQQSLQKSQQEIKLNAPTPSIFSCELKLVNDSDIINKIDKKYKSTLQNMHSSSSLKLKRVYSVKIDKQFNEFKEKGEKIGNIQELWHGTKTANLLSILKSGLIIPPKGNPNVTGRMFGDGLYFSDQSTKSLNYSHGYWSGTKDDNCYMFLCDVAMGKEYIPKSYSETLPKAGYNSTFAKANHSGVMNNEMIVYNTYQATLKYLVEFIN